MKSPQKARWCSIRLLGSGKAQLQVGSSLNASAKSSVTSSASAAVTRRAAGRDPPVMRGNYRQRTGAYAQLTAGDIAGREPESQPRLSAAPVRGLLEPLREPVHAALAGGFRGAVVVRPLVARAPDLFGPQGGDLLEGKQLLAVAGQGGPQPGARLPDRGVEDLLERAVLAQ